MLAKRTFFLALVFVACLSFGAQKNSSRKFWLKQYAQINSIFTHKDAAAFEALLAPDYFEIDEKGKKLNRAEFVAKEIEPMTQAGTVKSKVKVTNISEKGDDAKISYDWKYWITQSDMKIAGRETGYDTWHKSGGKWLNTSTVVKSSTEKSTPIKKKR